MIKNLVFGLLMAAAAAVGTAYGLSSRHPVTLLQRGCDALQRGDGQRALQLAERLEELGYSHHARLLRGKTWLRTGRSSAPARESLRQALEQLAQVRLQGPLGEEAAVLSGECLVHLGDFLFAAEVLEAVARRSPDNREAHRWLAAIYIELNCPYRAIHHLTEWGRLAPEDGRPWRWIGLFQKDYGRADDAVAAYREALRRGLQPAVRHEVLRELAETLIDNSGQFQAALAVLAEAPEDFVVTAEFLALRAECHRGLGDTAEAMRLAEAALDKDARQPRAHLIKARCLLAERPREAASLLEAVAEADPYNVSYCSLLVQAYQLLNDRDQAQACQKRFQEANRHQEELTRLHREAAQRPWDGQPRRELARLCLEGKQVAAARMWAQAALACNPADPFAREILTKSRAERSEESRTAP